MLRPRTKRPSPTRSVRPLSLTAQGRKVYEAVVPYAISLEETLLNNMPKESAQQFRAALARLADDKTSFDLLDRE